MFEPTWGGETSKGLIILPEGLPREPELEFELFQRGPKEFSRHTVGRVAMLLKDPNVGQSLFRIEVGNIKAMV